MYVPNNNVRLVSVPLDPSYRHTYTFVSASAQTNFFLGKVKYSLSDVQYVRQNRTLRIKLPEYKVLECTYLMWQNADVSDKWYYAFITGTNYCSPDVSEITFELDTLQTFYFDFQIGQCFVEREHTNNDTVGANLEPEPVAVGELISLARTPVFYTDFVLQIAYVPHSYTTDSGGGDGGDGGITVGPETRASVAEPINGSIFQGYYYPMEVKTLPLFDISTIDQMLDRILEKYGPNAISSIVQMPAVCAVDNYETTVTPGRITAFGNYVPKNNKLLTSPYCNITVNNMNGQRIVVGQEYFTANPGFRIQSVSGPGASLVCTPLNYKGQVQYWADALKLDAGVPVPWSYNLYQMYVIENKTQLYLQNSQAPIGTLASAFSLNGVVAFNSLMQSVNQAGMLEDMSRHPTSIQGQVHNDLFNLKYGLVGFAFESFGLRPENAQRIDDFFSTYGYATNRLKKPNITGRASWNYVKCANPSVGGNAPAFALRRFEDILSAGITFWHGDFIGDYSRPNGIVGG